MKIDIKVYENGEERETIRDLKHSQFFAVTEVFERHNIEYQAYRR